MQDSFGSRFEKARMDERPVIVIQQGARRNYVYARQLEAAGLLNYVACDAAWPEQSSRRLARLTAPFGSRLSGVVLRRSIKGVPSCRICATLWPNVASLVRHFIDEEQFYDIADEALAWRLRLRGLRGAKIVLNYFGNGGSFLTFAKRRGAKVITDFINSANAREIQRRENDRWPEWSQHRISQTTIDIYRRRFEWLLGISDFYLCPSEIVADGLAELPNFDPSRVRIIPYGPSGALRNEPNPERGRVLFAGSDFVRKGLPYLAEAALILKGQQPGIKVFIAGDAPPMAQQRAETKCLTFLGHLDRSAMAREFARADVFCLPSLSEGSATVIYEAFACGVPVVTTRATGSVLREGVEGLIVPLGDGPAIAASIAAIVGDRDRRDAMSKAALATAASYGEDRCGAMFLDVIKECLKADR
jgi:glycosyltransferase involved in cell wall biosynthesis